MYIHRIITNFCYKLYTLELEVFSVHSISRYFREQKIKHIIVFNKRSMHCFPTSLKLLWIRYHIEVDRYFQSLNSPALNEKEKGGFNLGGTLRF